MGGKKSKQQDLSKTALKGNHDETRKQAKTFYYPQINHKQETLARTK
jgi:hypothetical protein